jgi:hypothetical protein
LWEIFFLRFLFTSSFPLILHLHSLLFLIVAIVERADSCLTAWDPPYILLNFLNLTFLTSQSTSIVLISLLLTAGQLIDRSNPYITFAATPTQSLHIQNGSSFSRAPGRTRIYYPQRSARPEHYCTCFCRCEQRGHAGQDVYYLQGRSTNLYDDCANLQWVVFLL